MQASRIHIPRAQPRRKLKLSKNKQSETLKLTGNSNNDDGSNKLFMAIYRVKTNVCALREYYRVIYILRQDPT